MNTFEIYLPRHACVAFGGLIILLIKEECTISCEATLKVCVILSIISNSPTVSKSTCMKYAPLSTLARYGGHGTLKYCVLVYETLFLLRLCNLLVIFSSFHINSATETKFIGDFFTRGFVDLTLQKMKQT